MANQCRQRRCIALLSNGHRCKNCINVDIHPERVYCWVHVTNVVMPVKILNTISKTTNVSTKNIKDIHEWFQNFIIRIGIKSYMDQQIIRDYLCCSISEYAVLVRIFKAMKHIKIQQNVNPLVIVMIGFTLFYGWFKFEPTELDLTLNKIWDPVKIWVSFSEFRELFFKYGTDTNVINVLMKK